MFLLFTSSTRHSLTFSVRIFTERATINIIRTRIKNDDQHFCAIIAIYCITKRATLGFRVIRIRLDRTVNKYVFDNSFKRGVEKRKKYSLHSEIESVALENIYFIPVWNDVVLDNVLLTISTD